MIEVTIPAVMALFAEYGYSILFPVAILEGPLVSIVGGILVSRGILNGVLVFLVLLLGDIAGDTLYYALGRWGGRRAAHRWGRYIGVNEERALVLEKQFHRNDWKLILLSKTQAIGSAILFSAGMAKMRYSRFIGWNILGSVPKTLLFLAIGFYFGESIPRFEGALNYAALGSFIIAALLIGMYFLIRKRAQEETADITHE